MSLDNPFRPCVGCAESVDTNDTDRATATLIGWWHRGCLMCERCGHAIDGPVVEDDYGETRHPRCAAIDAENAAEEAGMRAIADALSGNAGPSMADQCEAAWREREQLRGHF